MTVELTTYSADETLAFGRQLGKWLECGDIVALYGDLGSGKTQLTRGICEGLNCHDDVTSPTFTLINEYEGRCPIYHFDVYRIDSDEDLFSLGYEEYFDGNGICIIEWAERIITFLPSTRLDIFLEHQFEAGRETIRSIRVIGRGNFMNGRNWRVLQHGEIA
ncbi:tRNA (adenosine(37)-N6)-threonylcarbamoyltransferase complex ATPase subunit type 1 TsaE [candidate division KSB1 bacterium]|nr:tRNA (adenosine(37)-N6)-threonylcarbamoyltransferase complex ATPase subunit type 1 TsaE [candidate division KSB1 bacterium]